MSFGSHLSLNPEQRVAVEHGEGPLLVLAGAGSGKTRVLTARVARLIEVVGVPPERILAVTFTNRAAGEMRERIEALLGRSTRGMWVGTFHSVAARLLRREADHAGRDRAFTIYDEDDALRALKEAMEAAGVDPKRWSATAIRSRISSAKNALVRPREYAPVAFDLLSRATADVYPVYQRVLARRNAYDFDDLLAESVRLLEKVPEVRERYAGRFLHVLVDEYQDTNHAQYRMVRALGAEHGNVCVVGDDDQSIYGWRGADLRNILDFERDFAGAEVVRLERNYRSTGTILEAANSVIANNVDRKPKRLRSQREEGRPVLVARAADERAEAAWTVDRIRELVPTHGPGDAAILYRTNAQSRAYEEALRRAGLPYRIVGGVPFYERREVKDVLAYLRLATNPADDAAFLRAVGWPRRGVGSVTLERLGEARREGESLLGAAARAEGIPELPTAGARALAVFAGEVAGLAELQREADAREVLEACVRRFGLAAALEEEEDGEDRLENVTELVAAAAAFDRADVEEALEEASDLELYLQSVALRSEIDDAELDADAVTLMTLHNAKGLEFPVVFLGGLEEGLFPLFRALEEEGGLEEERRLFYVGATRAMDRLHITYADQRWRAGSRSAAQPSSFLEELPTQGVERRIVGAAPRGRGRRRPDRPSVRRPGAPGRPRGRRGRPEEPDGSAFSWRHDPADDAVTGPSDGGGGEGELAYDFTDSQVPLELSPGSRVVHPRFGEGEVLSVSGRGRSAKAAIDFAEVGTKKVVLAFADLRPA